jgi:hypothetical protein
MFDMERCENSLFIYGSPLFSAPVRDAAVAIFGPHHSYDLEIFNRDRSGPPLIALVGTATSQLPPIQLVAEFSRRVPELTFYLHYHHYGINRNGGIEFKAGRVIVEWHEHAGLITQKAFFAGTETPAAKTSSNAAIDGAGQKAAVQPEVAFVEWLADKARLCRLSVEPLPDSTGRPPVSALPSLAAVAEELLNRALAGTASEAAGDAGSCPYDYGSVDCDVAWASYRSVKALLTKAEAKALEPREAQYAGFCIGQLD